MRRQRSPGIVRQNRTQNARFQVQSIAATPRFSSRGESPIVVIVDDDAAVCGSLKFLLELEGFGVRAYVSAAELLDAGDLAACDCFVIDQRMPAMTGMELIVRLRDLKVQTPAILLISHPNPAVSARAAIAGVAVVEKPLLSNTLVDEIREACARN
jgi:two-component system, LuxR family, response regulator FixJ